MSCKNKPVDVKYIGKIVRSTNNGASWNNATTDNSTANHLYGVTFSE
jgi:hypothetical protein